MTSGEEKMPILRDIRRRFHRYRFEDLPPETQEAIRQVEEYERECRAEIRKGLVVSKGIEGRRYELYESPRYLRDREYLESNGYDLAVLDGVISMLLEGERLPRRCKVHRLRGDKEGLWDCHIKDDWILLYRYRPDGLVLEAVRTGGHRRLLRIRSTSPSPLNYSKPYTFGGSGIMISFRRRRRQPTVAQIERAISKVADEYGYGNVWLFGNYYAGLYSDGCPVQVMLDSSEDPQHPLAFAGACRRETGLDAVVYLSDTDPRLTDYVMRNSRLIHHA